MAKQRVQVSPVTGFGSYRSTPKTSSTLDTFSGAPALEKSPLVNLAKSLGIATENYLETRVSIEKKKQLELQAKKSVYIEKIKEEKKKRLQKDKNDTSLNVIDKVKIGELFPEMSETTSMIVAEAMGKNATKTDLENWKENLLKNNPDIVNNKSELEAEINRKKQELLNSGNGDFYTSGALNEFNSLVSSWSDAWSKERSTFHKKQIMEALDGDIEKKLNDVTSPKGLKGVGEWVSKVADEKNKEYGALKNQEFNKTVVDSYIRYADKFNDVSVLDAIPDKFLNQDAKDKIEKFRESITRDNRADIEWKRKNKERDDEKELNVEKNKILDAAQSKDPDDLEKLRKKWAGQTTENAAKLKIFIRQIKENETYISEGQSKTNSDSLSDKIQEATVSGNWTFLFGENYEGSPSNQEIQSKILSRTDLRSQEKINLNKQVSKLMLGYGMKNHPLIKDKMDLIEETITNNMKTNKTFMDMLNRQGLALNFLPNLKKEMELSLKSNVQAWLENPDRKPGERPDAATVDKMITDMERVATNYQKSVTQLGKDTDMSQKLAPPAFTGYTVGGKTVPLKTNEVISQENINDGKPSKYIGTRPEDLYNIDKYVPLEGEELNKFNEAVEKRKKAAEEKKKKEAKEKENISPSNQKIDPDFKPKTYRSGEVQSVNMRGYSAEDYQKKLDKYVNNKLSEQAWVTYAKEFKRRTQQDLAHKKWKEEDTKKKDALKKQKINKEKEQQIKNIENKLKTTQNENVKKALQKRLDELRSEK